MHRTTRRLVAVVAAVGLSLPLLAPSARAADDTACDPFACSAVKVGASGRVYTWSSGGC